MRARERALNVFSWDKIGQKVCALYDEVLNERLNE